MPPVLQKPSGDLGVRICRGGAEGGGEGAECVNVIMPITHDEEVLLRNTELLLHVGKSGALVKAGIREAHVAPRALDGAGLRAQVADEGDEGIHGGAILRLDGERVIRRDEPG